MAFFFWMCNQNTQQTNRKSCRGQNCQLPIANCQLAVMISGEELITRTITMMMTTATMILMTMISILMIHSLNNNKRSPASFLSSSALCLFRFA